MLLPDEQGASVCLLRAFLEMGVNQSFVNSACDGLKRHAWLYGA